MRPCLGTCMHVPTGLYMYRPERQKWSSPCCARSCLVELRTLESVPGMALFAVTTFVVFHFALNQDTVSGQEAAGILWVTLLFAAMLGVNRLFVADADEGGFDGFLLAPG